MREREEQEALDAGHEDDEGKQGGSRSPVKQKKEGRASAEGEAGEEGKEEENQEGEDLSDDEEYGTFTGKGRQLGE